MSEWVAMVTVMPSRSQTGQSAGKCRVVTMDIQAVDKGQHMERVEFKPLADSGCSGGLRRPVLRHLRPEVCPLVSKMRNNS